MLVLPLQFVGVDYKKRVTFLDRVYHIPGLPTRLPNQTTWLATAFYKF